MVVKPRLNGSNHFAIGAKISVTYNGVTNIRLITAGTSHFGQEPAEAFFGVGNNSFVDEIKIEWPDNTETIVNNISSNQVITVMPSGVLKANKNAVTTIKIYPNPVISELSIKTNKNIEKFEIYNLIGQKVLENTFSKKINNLNDNRVKILLGKTIQDLLTISDLHIAKTGCLTLLEATLLKTKLENSVGVVAESTEVDFQTFNTFLKNI